MDYIEETERLVLLNNLGPTLGFAYDTGSIVHPCPKCGGNAFAKLFIVNGADIIVSVCENTPNKACDYAARIAAS